MIYSVDCNVYNKFIYLNVFGFFFKLEYFVFVENLFFILKKNFNVYIIIYEMYVLIIFLIDY